MSIIRSLCCLVCAAFACQFPAFEAHYESRLAARLQECQKQIALFEQAAVASGHNLDSYIRFFASRSEPEFTQSASVMQSTLDRKEKLAYALDKLENSPYPQKFIAWAFTLNIDLAKDTWKAHHLSFVLNTSTIVFAIAGALIGYIACSLLAVMARRSLVRRGYK